jgi:hypothetical protein
MRPQPPSRRSSHLVALLRVLLLLLALCGLHTLLLAGWLPVPRRDTTAHHQLFSWSVVDPQRSQLQPQLEPQPRHEELVSLRKVLLHLTEPTTLTTSPATPSTAGSPNLSSSSTTTTTVAVDACRPHEGVVWEEWRACVIAHALASRHISFETFIVEQAARLPWSLRSNHTAVLLEFRPLERQLAFSIRNAMDNLPVHWRVQAVGGPGVCKLVRQIFPIEVHAGKVVVTDLGIGDYMRQVRRPNRINLMLLLQ